MYLAHRNLWLLSPKGHLHKLRGIDKIRILCCQLVPDSWHCWISPSKGVSALPKKWLRWRVRTLSAQNSPFKVCLLLPVSEGWAVDGHGWLLTSPWMFLLVWERVRPSPEQFLADNGKMSQGKKQNWAMVNFSHQNGICHSTNISWAVLWAAVFSRVISLNAPYPMNRHYLLVFQMAKQTQRC